MAILPESRLTTKDPLANQRAIDDQRRAANSERISMATTRTMQRQYRRAVRHGDLKAISVLGQEMQGLGVNPLGGGGITSALQQQQIAVDRANGRADLQMKIRGGLNPGSRADVAAVDRGASNITKAGSPQSNIRQSERNRLTMEFRPGIDDIVPSGPAGSTGARAGDPGQGATGQPQAASAAFSAQTNGQPAGRRLSFDEEERLAQDRVFGKQALNPLQQFAEDLRNSPLIQAGDVNAIARANERGATLGLSPSEITAFLNGNPGQIDVSGAPRAIVPVKERDKGSSSLSNISEKYAGLGFQDGDVELAREIARGGMSQEAKSRSDKEEALISSVRKTLDDIAVLEKERQIRRDSRFSEIDKNLEGEKAKADRGLKVQQKQTADYFADLAETESYNNSIANNPLKNAFMDRRAYPEAPVPLNYDKFDESKPNFGQDQPLYVSQYRDESINNRGGGTRRVFSGESESLPSLRGFPTMQGAHNLDKRAAALLGTTAAKLNQNIPSRREMERLQKERELSNNIVNALAGNL